MNHDLVRKFLREQQADEKARKDAAALVESEQFRAIVWTDFDAESVMPLRKAVALTLGIAPPHAYLADNSVTVQSGLVQKLRDRLAVAVRHLTTPANRVTGSSTVTLREVVNLAGHPDVQWEVQSELLRVFQSAPGCRAPGLPASEQEGGGQPVSGEGGKNEKNKRLTSWKLLPKESVRPQGYRRPLYGTLSEMHTAGQPKPGASEVLAMWRAEAKDGRSRPGIVSVRSDDFDYVGESGNGGTATRVSLGRAIRALIRGTD
jgi:hypothetical protein